MPRPYRLEAGPRAGDWTLTSTISTPNKIARAINLQWCEIRSIDGRLRGLWAACVVVVWVRGQVCETRSIVDATMAAAAVNVGYE